MNSSIQTSCLNGKPPPFGPCGTFVVKINNRNKAKKISLQILNGI